MPKIKAEENRRFFYNATALTRSVKSSKHYHSLYEIYYLEQGVCHYLIEGKLFEMAPGDIVFIPKGIIHKTAYQDMHSRLLINCSGEYLENVNLSEAFVYRNEKHKGELYSILKSIEREYLHADGFSDSLIKGYMQQLLAIVYRTKNKYENTRLQNEYVERALERLNEDYTSDITLTALAEEYKVSPEHFSRVFKKETGLGFNEYISLLRLKKAETMLKQNEDLSISEIAFSCGFNDSNYFCEKFKKVYGIPPSKYKKSLILK